MPVNNTQPLPPPVMPLDIPIAGWFLIIASIWELMFNRMAYALGFMKGVGAGKLAGMAADSGQLAMNSTGIMALVLSGIFLLGLSCNRLFAPLPFRIFLMLISPFCLPVICVAIFRAVLPQIVQFGYLVSIGIAVLITMTTSIKKIGSSERRVIVLLGLMITLGVWHFFTVTSMVAPAQSFRSLTWYVYLMAQVIPIFAMLTMLPGSLREFAKHPHLPALIIATFVTAVVAVISIKISPIAVPVVMMGALGMVASIPGGPVLFCISLFAGTMLVTSLILPSRRWPVNMHSRRIGFGLIAVWTAGIQPLHPYQFVLLLTGFLFLSAGMIGDDLYSESTTS